MKPKAPPKGKAASKHKDLSETSEESQDFEEDESLAPESPEQSSNPFLKREYEEEKEIVKQELNFPPKQSEQEVQPAEATLVEPEEQRNIFGSSPSDLLLLEIWRN